MDTQGQGTPAASRLLPNGNFDPTFGDSGTFVFPPFIEPAGKVANNDPISKRESSHSANAGKFTL